ICLEFQPQCRDQLGGTSLPGGCLCREQSCHLFEKRVRWLLPEFFLCVVKLPEQSFFIPYQIHSLVRLIPANHIQRGYPLGSFFLLEYKGTVCTAQQTRGAGDHIKFISRRGFPGMMDNQQADAMVVRELFEAPDDLVIL